MSNSFSVNYDGLNNAVSLINRTNDNLSSYLKEISSFVLDLNNPDIFQGKLCDDLMDSWNIFNTKFGTTIDVLSILSNYIDVSNENYADADKLAEKILTNNSITGITFTKSYTLGSDITSSQKLQIQNFLDRGDNKSAIWLYLKAKGLSDVAAAGVMGNIQAESNFVFDVNEHSNGMGYGLIQWTGGRRTSLEKAAKEAGVNVSDPFFQLEYLWNESLEPSTWYGQRLASKGFYETTSPVDAAIYFHNIVEKSADSKTRVKNYRGGSAKKIYDNYSSYSI